MGPLEYGSMDHTQSPISFHEATFHPSYRRKDYNVSY